MIPHADFDSFFDPAITPPPSRAGYGDPVLRSRLRWGEQPRVTQRRLQLRIQRQQQPAPFCRCTERAADPFCSRFLAEGINRLHATFQSPEYLRLRPKRRLVLFRYYERLCRSYLAHLQPTRAPREGGRR